MEESRLCSKIKLTEMVEQLDDEACFKLLQQGLRCENIKDIFKKLLFLKHFQLFTNQSLKDMCNQGLILMNQLSNENKSNDTTNQTMTNKINTKEINHITRQNSICISKLLPFDIIKHISYFLNKFDIVIFEQCCREYYEMINNKSFISKHKDFEYFKLDDYTIEIQSKQNYYKDIVYYQDSIEDRQEMTRRDFYKFSYCKHLHFQGDWIRYFGPYLVDFSGEQRREALEDQWNCFLAMECFCEDEYHSNWLMDMFKSVKKITFDGISFIYLLYGIPVFLFLVEKESESQSESIVFPLKSNLEEISIGKLEDEQWELKQNEWFGKITENFSQFFEKNRNLVKKKVLKFLDVDWYSTLEVIDWFSAVKSFDMKHLKFGSHNQYLSLDDIVGMRKHHPSLTTLTFDGSIKIESSVGVNDKLNENCQQLHIENLRLTNMPSWEHENILSNSKYIDCMNLKNSLKHLLIHIDFVDECRSNTYVSLFRNDFFDKLQSIDLLFNFDIQDEAVAVKSSVKRKWIKSFFRKLFSSQDQLLRYSNKLKQINIGFKEKGNKGYVFSLFKNDKFIYDINIYKHDEIMVKKLSQGCDTDNQQLQNEFTSRVQQFNELFDHSL